MGIFSSIAGSLVGGLLNRGADKKARGAQQAGINEQRRQFDLVRGDTEPYRQAGQEGLNYLQQILMGDNADFSNVTNRPYFEFQRNQGEKRVRNYLANKGLSRSGRGMKEILKYNQNYAGGRMDNYLAQLAGMANYGVGGINQSAAAGGRAATGISNIYNQQAENAYRTGNNYNTAFQGGMQNYLLNKQLNSGGNDFMDYTSAT